MMSTEITPIVFNRPAVLESSFKRVREALESGHLSGMGRFTSFVESQLGEINSSLNLVTTSATHSLEMMAISLGLNPGDEVIVPSFTFVTSALAFHMHGASIRFCDVDENGQIDLADVQKKINLRTRAVLAVHYAGNSCDMQRLSAICVENKILLFEDAAQAIGSRYDGRPLGTIGELGCYSFHETKNISAGEGGALIVNNRDRLSQLLCIREKGTNRRDFEKNFVDKYSWVEAGSSYVLSELCVSYLYSQLEHYDEIQQDRKSLWEKYLGGIAPQLEKSGGRVITPHSKNDPNYHLFAIVLRTQEQRNQFMAHMKDQKINCPFHYVPLHESQFSKKQGYDETECPSTSSLSRTLVRIPMYYKMESRDSDRVISCAVDFLKRL